MIDKSVIHWFPMRVTYNRELKIKKQLDKLGIESYIPMRYAIVEDNNDIRREIVPAIHNLIFVHASQETITNLKMTKKEFEPLRYIMRRHLEDLRLEIITLEDKKMNDFIRVASDEKAKYLDMSDYIKAKGKRVRVIGGKFEGIEGVVKRIHGNKHVVIALEDIAAIGFMCLPAILLEIK